MSIQKFIVIFQTISEIFGKNRKKENNFHIGNCEYQKQTYVLTMNNFNVFTRKIKKSIAMTNVWNIPIFNGANPVQQSLG